MLNLALISGLGLESLPDSALARAAGYQVAENGAFGKFCRKLTGEAAPRVPEVAVQPSASQLARMVIVGPLVSVAPQTFAANWKAFKRCWPRVVPGLPPTGATDVGSLNPVPAASTSFRITTVACPEADEAATRLTASKTRRIESFLRTFLSVPWRSVCGLVTLNQLRIDSEEFPCRARIVDAGGRNSAVGVFVSHDYVLKAILEVH